MNLPQISAQEKFQVKGHYFLPERFDICEEIFNGVLKCSPVVGFKCRGLSNIQGGRQKQKTTRKQQQQQKQERTNPKQKDLRQNENPKQKNTIKQKRKSQYGNKHPQPETHTKKYKIKPQN